MTLLGIVGLWEIGILALARVTVFLYLVPLLGGSQTPSVVKVALGLGLTAFFLPRLALPPQLAGWQSMEFFALLAKEIVIGLIMGFTLRLVLAALQVAGELIGFQMMFSAASTFSTLNQEQTTVISDWFSVLAMLVFISLNGHFALVAGLDQSFRELPVWAWPRSLGGLKMWAGSFAQIFVFALKLALPLMAALFIANLTLGLIARTLPQINVFVVGLPLQILAGFLVLLLMLGGLVAATEMGFKQWSQNLHGLIRALAF